MSDVNVYYLGSPKCIFGAELDSGLITLDKAHELCAKKYVQPHITDKNEIATPLTQQEMEQIKLQFPEVVKRGMPPCALSPMVQQLSDPDGMGATQTHQADIQQIDTDIWTAEEGSKDTLPVPF